MTIALLTTAALCLFFAAFCFFGVPYLVMGPRVADQLRDRTVDKAILGALLAAAISLVWVLQASPALISPAGDVQVVADQTTGGWQV
jgi:hypothetical protein